MTSRNFLDKQILALEEKIRSSEGDIQSMKKELERLKLMAFEEDFRNDDNRQLLNG